ncbi:MAG: hypothetical protein IIB56_04110 [Planctomycetes bacterium]|nr:hypothetical protein [Planctomycetota bacterium]MCH8119404.1 hypothetical protein [Planctomycetota bacterium]
MLIANVSLIPSYDMLGMPILPWIVQVLMALTLALHWSFLAMTAGGATAYVVNRYNSLNSDTVALKGLSAFLPFSLSMAMTLGIAPLLFVQVLYGNFFYTANILMGYVWLGLLVLMIANFYLLYLGFWLSKHQRGVRCVGILILLLLAGSALILSSNATLTQSPQAWEAFRANKGIALYLGDTTLLPRWTFAIFALLAGGGLFVAIYALLRSGTKNETAGRAISKAVLVSVVGMAGILISGFWASRSLPQATRSSLFSSGESVFAYAAAASFVLALVLTLSSWFKKSVLKLGLSAVLFFLGLLAMAALRDTLRRIALGKQLNLAEIPVHSQWDSFALFLVIFILGLMLVGYIVKEGFFNRPKLQVGG